MKLKDMGEFGLIDQIKTSISNKNAHTKVGINDDAAVLKFGNEILLLTVDTLIENVHFRLDTTDFFSLGIKSLAVNISDIAAMGGKSTSAVISIGIPGDMESDSILELYKGLNKIATQFDVDIVGGDTVHSPEHLMITVTLLGTPFKEPLMRSDAQIGDAVLVTHTLGDSAAGLYSLQNNIQSEVCQKHLVPIPRQHEIEFILKNFDVNACIDISDGLASEINHIAKNSDLGAIIKYNHIPIADTTRDIAEKQNKDPVDFALYGGEDFELLFTMPCCAAEKLIESASFPVKIIGEILPKTNGVILQKNGEIYPLKSKGYDHFPEE